MMEKVINTTFSESTNILYGDSPSYSGIVAGECKGDVWVDNKVDPTLALVYSFAVEGFSIMGNPEDTSTYDELIKFLKEKLFVELKNKGIDYFEFSVESKRAEVHILKLFSNKKMNQEDEYFYRNACMGEVSENNHYNITQINTEFIEQLQAGYYDNPEFLSERLLESWGTYDRFLSKSLAYAATLESSIIAVIVGTARYKNVIPVDIEVNKDHSKKGLASTLTQHFVNESVERGLIVQWDCVDSNIASKRTAEKTGFSLIKKKPYYWFGI
jgi:predicted GNAT family acetyltransferase